MRIAPFAFVVSIAVLAACGGAQSSQANNAQANLSKAARPAATAAASVVTTRVSGLQALQIMHDRHEAMEQLAKSMKELHRALTATPPDIVSIRAQTATMANIAPKIAGWFPAGTGPDVGKTRAKPEVWQQQGLLRSKAKDFVAATQAIDAAARAGDINKTMALHQRVDDACDACHKPFRAPEH